MFAKLADLRRPKKRLYSRLIRVSLSYPRRNTGNIASGDLMHPHNTILSADYRQHCPIRSRVEDRSAPLQCRYGVLLASFSKMAQGTGWWQLLSDEGRAVIRNNYHREGNLLEAEQ